MKPINSIGNDEFRKLLKPKIKRNDEEALHSAVAKHIKLKYPWAMFNVGMEGVRLPIHTAKRFKALRSDDHFPDIIIFQPRKCEEPIWLDVPPLRRDYWSGLAIELKKSGTKLFKRNNGWATQHIADQARTLEKLAERGFYAQFSVGFSSTIAIIDWYLN